MKEGQENSLNGYTLSRSWFDFAFENPDLVNTNHSAMFFWFIELNNRMGWATKFSCPASQTMAAIGIKSYNTYKKTFDDLVGFGVVQLIKESKNQYTACVIALSNFDKAPDKALDKAMTTHSSSTEQSTSSINKQLNQETNKQTKPLSAAEIFNEAHAIYPSWKRSAEVEWEELKHLHPKEYQSLPQQIFNAIQKQIEWRQKEKNADWVPKWPSFSNWIKEKRWTDILPAKDQRRETKKMVM